MPYATRNFLSRQPATVLQIQNPRNWAKIAQTADCETQGLMQKLREGQLDSTQFCLSKTISCIISIQQLVKIFVCFVLFLRDID